MQLGHAVSTLRAILWGSPWPYRLVRLFLAGLFLWAGAAKLLEPRAFARLISSYGLAPESLLVPIAVGLPLIEVLVGLGLAFDIRGSAASALALLLLFVAVLGFGLMSELDVDCGCFSVEDTDRHNGLKTALWRDLALLAMVSYLMFRRWARRQPGRWAGSSELGSQLCKEEYR